MQDIVEKYGTYREIKNMMGRLRQMWRSEASENRKARQLKSFVELYKGRMQIEDLLKEKLGMSTRKSAETIKELEDIEKWDKVTWPASPSPLPPSSSSYPPRPLSFLQEIAALEAKLEQVKLVIPEGMSTRMERFGY